MIASPRLGLRHIAMEYDHEILIPLLLIVYNNLTPTPFVANLWMHSDSKHNVKMGVVTMEELVDNHVTINWVDKWGIHV